MNIYEKINEVMKRIEYLTKDDKVSFGTTQYKAISEEKVTTAVRNEMVNVGIVIIPIEQEMNVVELMRTDKSVNQRTDVNTKYRIQNIDDVNDYIIASSSGSGVDTQDKGVGKAMTYAYKYLLLRTFAIPTGEDPDKISSAEIDDRIAKEKATTQNKADNNEKQQTISLTMEKALKDSIKNNEIPNEVVIDELKKLGHTKLSELLLVELMNFKKAIGV
jgi:hypothetical protein